MVSNLKTAFTPLVGRFYVCNPFRLLKNHFSSIGKNLFNISGKNNFFKKSYLLFTLFLLMLLFIYKQYYL